MFIIIIIINIIIIIFLNLCFPVRSFRIPDGSFNWIQFRRQSYSITYLLHIFSMQNEI